jgi:hypothetical protein
MLRLLDEKDCNLEAGMKAVGAKAATVEAVRAKRQSFMVSN